MSSNKKQLDALLTGIEAASTTNGIVGRLLTAEELDVVAGGCPDAPCHQQSPEYTKSVAN